MDSVEVIQKVVTAFATSFAPNATTNATIVSSLPTSTSAFSNTVSSLWSMFLSFSALRDWFKLIIVGGAIETARRLCFGLWYYIIESVWVTASFDEDDSSYGELSFAHLRGSYSSHHVSDWIMFWLSQHPKWSKHHTPLPSL